MPLSNLTPETATEVLLSQLPYITNLNVLEGGTIRTVYYKITNDLTHDAVITLWFYANVLANNNVYYTVDYEGFTDVYISYQVFDAFPNCATEIPIKKNESYWIRASQYGTGTTSPVLNVNISLKPYSTTYPAGQIVIFSASSSTFFDSKGGLHAGFIDPVSGQIVNFIPFFPATEQGDALANGTYLIADQEGITKPDPPGEQDTVLLKLDATFHVTARIIVPGPTVGQVFMPLIRTNHATNKFWIGQAGYSGGPNRYASVSAAGILSPMVTLADFSIATTIKAVAATNNESHLLIVPFMQAINNIHKWNLSTLAWDGTIGATVPGYYVRDLLVLADDTIIVIYDDMNKNSVIKRYNLAGTLLNNFPITTAFGTTAGGRLGYAIDPLYFWLWLPLDDGTSLLKKFKATDFSLAVDKSVKNVYETSMETATPGLIYVSDSCPVIETRVYVAPPLPDMSGIYFINPIKTEKHDSYYNNTERKIPDPTIRTALIGD